MMALSPQGSYAYPAEETKQDFLLFNSVSNRLSWRTVSIQLMLLSFPIKFTTHEQTDKEKQVRTEGMQFNTKQHRFNRLVPSTEQPSKSG